MFRLLLPKETTNSVPLISSHSIACFTLSANLTCHPNVASASDLPVMLPLFTACHCIYKSNQKGGQESCNICVNALSEHTIMSYEVV